MTNSINFSTKLVIYMPKLELLLESHMKDMKHLAKICLKLEASLRIARSQKSLRATTSLKAKLLFIQLKMMEEALRKVCDKIDLVKSI